MSQTDRFQHLRQEFLADVPAEKIPFMPMQAFINKFPPHLAIVARVMYNTNGQATTYFCYVTHTPHCTLHLNKVQYTANCWDWDEPYVHVVRPGLALASLEKADIEKIVTLDFSPMSAFEEVAVTLDDSDIDDMLAIIGFFPNVQHVIYKNTNITRSIEL